MIAILVLLVLTAGWVGIALIPAFRELARPRDDHALKVDMYEADVRSFATGFRRYMRDNLPALRPTRRFEGGTEGTLPDGTAVLKLVEQASPIVMHGEALDDVETAGRTTEKLVVSYAAMILPRGLSSVGGLYATDIVCGGESGVFRALLGERDVMLARNSVVLRWVHSDANLIVEEGTTLHGRASAERRLMLAANTTFERLYGRPIFFGEPVGDGKAMKAAEEEFRPQSVLAASPSRTIVGGDLEVPPGSTIEGNLVVRGALTIGRGSRVLGSLKCHGTLLVEPFCTVSGALVATGDIDIREGGLVSGPVIAEGDVILTSGVVIGEYASPTSVTAECVIAQPGAAVFGTVWTRAGGMVPAAGEIVSSAA